MILTKARSFQEKKKGDLPTSPRHSLLSEIGRVCFHRRTCLIFNFFTVFFCRGFPDRERQSGIQPPPQIPPDQNRDLTSFLSPTWNYWFQGPPGCEHPRDPNVAPRKWGWTQVWPVLGSGCPLSRSRPLPEPTAHLKCRWLPRSDVVSEKMSESFWRVVGSGRELGSLGPDQ